MFLGTFHPYYVVICDFVLENIQRLCFEGGQKYTRGFMFILRTVLPSQLTPIRRVYNNKVKQTLRVRMHSYSAIRAVLRTFNKKNLKHISK